MQSASPQPAAKLRYALQGSARSFLDKSNLQGREADFFWCVVASVRSSAPCSTRGQKPNCCVARMILSSSSSGPLARPSRQYSSWYSSFCSVCMLLFNSLCITPTTFTPTDLCISKGMLAQMKHKAKASWILYSFHYLPFIALAQGLFQGCGALRRIQEQQEVLI